MTEQSNDSNYHSVKNGKPQVKFVSKVDTRYYEGNPDENEGEVVIKDENAFMEDQNNESFTNISFENSSHKFVIDDDYYKVQKKIPKTVDQIKYFNEKGSEKNQEKSLIKSQIITIYNTLLDSTKMKMYEKEVHHRIDGILYDKEKKDLIIITDKYIIKYIYVKNNFKEKGRILITHIDYITLTRDNNYMILHLVEEAHQDNFTLANKKLNRVVGCLCSTFFYDKHDYSYPKDKMVMRKTPVILINQNMSELIRALEKAKEFHDYREEFNLFLNKRLKKLKVNIETYIYTCVNYKEAKDINFIQGDFVLDLYSYYIVEFNKNEFELIIKVDLKHITKMKTNNTIHSLVIYDDSKFPNGFEIKLNNYKALQELISSNIHLYNNPQK